MGTDRANDILIPTIRRSVLEVLKDEETLKETDGVYSYEVAPIPGDRLSEKEIQRIQTAAVPEDVQSSAVRADPPIHYYMEQLSFPREQ